MKILGIASNAFESERQEKSAFYNHEGWLSHYALDCGYMEQIDFWGDDPNNYLSVKLYKDGCYHVRYRYCDEDCDERVWNSFDNLVDARLDFKYYTLRLIAEVQKHELNGKYNKLSTYV